MQGYWKDHTWSCSLPSWEKAFHLPTYWARLLVSRCRPPHPLARISSAQRTHPSLQALFVALPSFSLPEPLSLRYPWDCSSPGETQIPPIPALSALDGSCPSPVWVHCGFHPLHPWTRGNEPCPLSTCFQAFSPASSLPHATVPDCRAFGQDVCHALNSVPKRS
jgi:hypothetical protein